MQRCLINYWLFFCEVVKFASADRAIAVHTSDNNHATSIHYILESKTYAVETNSATRLIDEKIMSIFKVREHTIQASHIREYHRSLADEHDDDLRLHVKQYTPLDNLNGHADDVTIIAGHANGFPKVSTLFVVYFADEATRSSMSHYGMSYTTF